MNHKKTTTQKDVVPNRAVLAYLKMRQQADAALGWTVINPGIGMFHQFITLSDFLDHVNNDNIYAWAYGRDLLKSINTHLSN